ncbi:MAG: hypothetical protein KDK30_00175 [Leptospiraceae bacterium]|nr:hypothetical protein [Leptospiraceae bacterium]
MNDQDRYQHALEAIDNFDFEDAHYNFGILLESNPDDVEFRCGFYASGYWANRREAYERKREGRPRAAYFIEEWDAFELQAGERGFPGCESMQATMRSILGTAADHFRIAFQEESAGAIDAGLLKQLSICLIRIEDYTNAADILMFARRKTRPDAFLLFLLGESLCRLDEIDRVPFSARGLSYYRDACLVDHRAIDPALIASRFAVRAFEKVYAEDSGGLESAQEWFPAALHALSFQPGLRQLTDAELDEVAAELARLTGDLERVIDRFKERVSARLCFYHLLFMYHHSYHEPDRTLVAEHEEALRALSESMLTLYRENRIGPGGPFG